MLRYFYTRLNVLSLSLRLLEQLRSQLPDALGWAS